MAIRLRSIRHKLLLLVVIANVCTLLAAGGALLYHDLTEARAKTVDQLTVLANILGQGSATALEFDDAKVATDNLQQLRANPNILGAALYRANGKLFARYIREGVRVAEIPAVPALDGHRFDNDELILFKRVVIGAEIIGTVYLRERYVLSQWLQDYLVILGGVLLASMLLGLAVYSQLERWISEPIQAVSTVARQVMAQRNFHLRAIKTTEDEIGQLADAFNGMLQTLEHEMTERSHAENAVRTLNAELEQRVAERTTALQVANQELVVRTEEAESANRAKADFLANMSHEIRTPMNAVLGLAYLLDQKPLDNDSAELVKKIRGAGRSLQSIINDILDVSKIDAGRLEIEHTPFRLTDVLDDLASIMGANLGNKDLELVIAPPPEIGVQLLGDALRLEQILINLTGNAIKFTESGSVKVGITLLAREDNTVTLRFSVADTGIGIPLEKQTQIFNAFSQADTSTTRRFGGTGLGLTICRHLVNKMGGDIGVISVPGKGSEFWFTIKVDLAEAKQYAPPELANLDVLIADDSEIARENLVLTARSIGWAPIQAESGEIAIQKMAAKASESHGFDVLLLDWKMPGLDGLAVAKSIRQSLGEQTAPIVLMVTAFSREELLKQSDINVVDGVLSKPVTGSSLYNSVAEALRRRWRDGQCQLSQSGHDKRLTGISVLVVDDSEINREVASRILQSEGATVSLAPDGKAAIDWLLSHSSDVDVVLMDVQMPVMDGYEATRQLRETLHLYTLPVIALT
ncbi:response regulator [Chitinivorax sp. B]|uniref:response regulator n=1 Tax=Chitinivorax sp. B TaxID=2502235 RepID=UPI0014850FEF|nr:response regulator [Chitinivorax sp. B]